MDFDPRITSDGSVFGEAHGWYCNFHSGYGHDVIDEDAETEKCCVQALQLLIAKADSEIHDLEDELAILQCQVKWAESNEQRDSYEVCCSVFKRKIDSLTSSIQSLRNGSVTNRVVTNEALKIQRPAERIHDIISSLIRHKFSESNEQVEHKRKELLVNSETSDIDTDLQQHVKSLESSIEFEERKVVVEMQEKPELVITEESSSVDAKYTTKDSKEGRDMSKFGGVSSNPEGDAYMCEYELKNGLSTLKPAMTSTNLHANEGNSRSDALKHEESERYITKSKISEICCSPFSVPAIVKAEEDYSDVIIPHINALRHEESEKYVAKSKISGSGYSPVSAQVIAKVEEDDNDVNISHVGVDFFSKLQDHDRDDSVEDHPKIAESQSQSIVSADLTYGRKRSSFSSILIPQGQKVQKKFQSHFGDAIGSIPTQKLEPLQMIAKTNSSSNAENSGQLKLSSKGEDRVSFLPRLNWGTKMRVEDDIANANTSQIVGAKQRKVQGPRQKSKSIQSPGRKVQEGKARGASKKLASKLRDGNERCPESPHIGEIKDLMDSDSGYPHDVENSSAIVEEPQGPVPSSYCPETLRLKLSQDPEYLIRLKIPELKEILRQNKLPGCYKLKKDKMIEELSKRLEL